MKRLALVTAAALIASLAGCSSAPPPVSDKVSQYYTEHATAAPVEGAKPAVKIDAALLSQGTKAAFVGDSWTLGYAAATSADSMDNVASRALGWEATVVARSGTGYLNPGNEKTYKDRLASGEPDPSMQVLVLQGGLNDAELDLTQWKPAVEETIAAGKVRYPNAQVILMSPIQAGVSPGVPIRTMNGALHQIAEEKGLPLISPIDEQWIYAVNYKDIIDTAAMNHPSTAGHAYLGDRLAKAIRSLAS